MKKLLVVILPLLTVSAAAQNWKTFGNDSILFTAKYPDNWVNKIKEGKRVFFTSPVENASDNFKENINIAVVLNEAFGTSITINEALPSVTAQLRTVIEEFTEESSRSFKWNGADAIEIIYTGYSKNDLTLKARFTQWFCFYKKRLYTLTFTAAAGNTTHNATAKTIMESIQFK
jgi:hypothetical protein